MPRGAARPTPRLEGAPNGAKKLRERAAKRLKSLAHVNLCAGSTGVVGTRQSPAERELGPETLRVGELPRHNDPRANPRALIKVDHVLICHADAAGRNRLPDRIRLVRAMDSIERAGEIHGARAERIVGPPSMWRGRSGRRLSICAGGVQSGHSRLYPMRVTPAQVNPGRPTPTPYLSA
jgi:hypothetical protein